MYVTNETRSLYAAQQYEQIRHDQLAARKSQLLLEQGALTVQSRVQTIAQQDLHMVFPTHHAVILLHR